ncbi:MAG: hypothetical protein IH950_16950 [Bacteroidetes bacterium]|nr:hypothetical protein [Bacteroidota bacterium]
MDNLFEYLIYGFIIISFISSFFKKKKRLQKEPADQTLHQRTDITEDKIIDIPPSQEPKAEEYDILKGIESFFDVEKPKQAETKVHTDKEMYEGAKDRENYIPVPEKSFHTLTASEHTFTETWDEKRKELEKREKREKREKNLSPKIEKQASVYEESLIRKVSTATGIIKDIKERLKSPSTLKEYVIISEIMGKPKALKR